MEYQLLAADMDGTLLNENKEITAENCTAINRALEQGKQVIFATGRSLGEVTQFFPLFPRMRYVLCESGALLYDIHADAVLQQNSIETEYVQEILQYAEKRDILLQLMIEGRCYFNTGVLDRLEHYQNAYLREHFRQTALFVPDAVQYCADGGWKAEKICMYHPSEEAREITRQRFDSLPVTKADSEVTSLEITPVGIDKGFGLHQLCRLLDIPMQAVIAVGDAPNDLPMLHAAGLSVAMGNAQAAIRSVCDAVVSDNEHHGVRDAIERYLLG